MIKYLGSKKRLLPLILDVIAQVAPRARTVLDLFSGTARVGHALKQAGYAVVANDHNAYAATLARCYIEADDTLRDDAERLLLELARVTPHAGWFTQTFCVDARYFTPDNGARIEAMRMQIARWSLPPTLEAVVMTSLLQAADRVDSTVGVQMAFLKSWAARALKPIALRLPALLPRARHGAGRVWMRDALDAARNSHTVDVDVAYLDPPYNQHSYLGNYHVWETLVRFDAPEVYGTARKRVDVKERTSPFNHKATAATSLHDVVDALRVRHVVLSFSDEGFFSPEQLASLLAVHGGLQVHEMDVSRYVGARIGIYNPQGHKVGRVSHTTNRELIFVVDKGPRRRLRSST